MVISLRFSNYILMVIEIGSEFAPFPLEFEGIKKHSPILQKNWGVLHLWMLFHAFVDDASCCMLIRLAIILFASAEPATTGSTTILVFLCPTLTCYFKPMRIIDMVTLLIENGTVAA